MQINKNIRIDIAGENALMLYFSLDECEQSSNENADKKVATKINAEINLNVQQAVKLIKGALNEVIIDLIPSYASMLVMFDLEKCDHYYLRQQLKSLLINCGKQEAEQSKLVELPVYYSVESGQDLARIAEHANISIDEVIQLHQAQEYRVYAIGFAPGFAYLGEVDNRIAMPRLATPRLNVPKGAVAIADRQTAVYPAQSPGGWNIIGLCPVDMFNATADITMPVTVGDRVKFVAINKEKYLALGGIINEN